MHITLAEPELEEAEKRRRRRGKSSSFNLKLTVPNCITCVTINAAKVYYSGEQQSSIFREVAREPRVFYIVSSLQLLLYVVLTTFA